MDHDRCEGAAGGEGGGDERDEGRADRVGLPSVEIERVDDGCDDDDDGHHRHLVEGVQAPAKVDRERGSNVQGEPKE